ncbi:MAG: hypothetical protein WC634_02230 [archaeon]
MASKIIRKKTLPGEQVNEKTPPKACLHNPWFVVMALQSWQKVGDALLYASKAVGSFLFGQNPEK